MSRGQASAVISLPFANCPAVARWGDSTDLSTWHRVCSEVGLASEEMVFHVLLNHCPLPMVMQRLRYLSSASSVTAVSLLMSGRQRARACAPSGPADRARLYASRPRTIEL